jgi:hypothetical protein
MPSSPTYSHRGSRYERDVRDAGGDRAASLRRRKKRNQQERRNRQNEDPEVAEESSSGGEESSSENPEICLQKPKIPLFGWLRDGFLRFESKSRAHWRHDAILLNFGNLARVRSSFDFLVVEPWLRVGDVFRRPDILFSKEGRFFAVELKVSYSTSTSRSHAAAIRDFIDYPVSRPALITDGAQVLASVSGQIEIFVWTVPARSAKLQPPENLGHLTSLAGAGSLSGRNLVSALCEDAAMRLRILEMGLETDKKISDCWLENGALRYELHDGSRHFFRDGLSLAEQAARPVRICIR